MSSPLLDMMMFGGCTIVGVGNDIAVTGSKHRALLVLLATAPYGRRSRTFLQDTLWGTTSFEGGRQNLRRALADLKKIFGPIFGELISATNSEIALDLSRVRFSGAPQNGPFIEGLSVNDRGFSQWVEAFKKEPWRMAEVCGPRSSTTMTSATGAMSFVPTIVVLPFRLVAGDRRHAVAGDWMAEEVSRSLSRSNLISVISHLSGRALSGRRLELETAQELLGIDYLVHGSMRQMGETLCFDADFIDARSGRIAWTHHFEASVRHVLHETTPFIEDLVRRIGRAIASDALRHVKSRPVPEVENQRLLVAGVSLMHRLTLTSFARSRQLIEEAVTRAPLAAESHAWLAEWYVTSIFNGWSEDIPRDIGKARDHVARALDIDPENTFCLTIDGAVHNNLLQRLDTAESRFSKALERNPNESLAWLFSGVLRAFRDQGQEAVSRAERAMKLSPLDPLGYFYDAFLASSCLAAHDFDRALTMANRSLEKNPRHQSTHRARICALHHLGRRQEAHTATASLLALQPDFTISAYTTSHPAAQTAFGKMHIEALVAAGAPSGE